MFRKSIQRNSTGFLGRQYRIFIIALLAAMLVCINWACQSREQRVMENASIEVCRSDADSVHTLSLNIDGEMASKVTDFKGALKSESKRQLDKRKARSLLSQAFEWGGFIGTPSDKIEVNEPDMISVTVTVPMVSYQTPTGAIKTSDMSVLTKSIVQQLDDAWESAVPE